MSHRFHGLRLRIRRGRRDRVKAHNRREYRRWRGLAAALVKVAMPTWSRYIERIIASPPEYSFLEGAL